MADIYEQIWAIPKSQVPVSRRGEDGEFLNPEADVLVDQQGKGGWILRFESDQRRAAAAYPGTGQGERVNFP